METIFNIKELRKDLVTKRVIELNIGLREAATLIKSFEILNDLNTVSLTK